MADYTGRGPANKGYKATGQYYQEIKWSDGKFYIKDSNGNETQQETLINKDHRCPNYTISFKLNANKQLAATFIRTKNSNGTQPRSGDYFCGKVGIEAWDNAHKNDVIYVQCQGNPNWNNNWAWGQNYGNGSDETINIDLSGLSLPIYIRAVCSLCSSSWTELVGFARYSNSPKYGTNGTEGGGAYKIVQGHTHIENPNPPVIVKTSGTTITVKCNPNDISANHRGYVRDVNDSTWYDDNHTFTGLKQKSTLAFSARRYCGDDCTNEDEINKYFESEDSTKGQTWFIDGGVVEDPNTSNTNSLEFQVVHYPGTNGGNMSDTNIICELYNSPNDRSSFANAIERKTVAGSGNVIFNNNISPNVTYYFRAWSYNIRNANGKLDNYIDLEAKTGSVFIPIGADVLSSATTIRASIHWVRRNSIKVTSKIKCTSTNITKTASDITETSYTHTTGFTGLEPDTTYEIEFNLKDESNNEYTITKSITTKRASCSVSNASSNALKIRAKSNDESNSQMSISLYNNDGSVNQDWSDIERLDTKIFKNLKDATIYKCKIKINNCYAYDENGAITTTNDSIAEQNVNTCYLTAIVSPGSIYSYQDAISFIMNTYLSPSLTAISQTSKLYTSDPITNFTYKISNIKIKPMAESGYCTPSSTAEQERSVPSSGWLVTERAAVISLDCYTKYQISVEIYDGYNKIWSTPFIAYTEFPYSIIYINDRWESVIPHIYKNGKWTPAIAYLNSNNSWKEPDSNTY